MLSLNPVKELHFLFGVGRPPHFPLPLSPSQPAGVDCHGAAASLQRMVAQNRKAWLPDPIQTWGGWRTSTWSFLCAGSLAVVCLWVEEPCVLGLRCINSSGNAPDSCSSALKLHITFGLKSPVLLYMEQWGLRWEVPGSTGQDALTTCLSHWVLTWDSTGTEELRGCGAIGTGALVQLF